MALDGSYGGLKASVADFLNRTDLTMAIPDFIALAEAQMTRRFVGRMGLGLPVPRRLIQRSDAGLTAGAEFLAVPDDFHGAVEFLLQSSPEIALDYLDPTVFQQWKEAGSLAGRPPAYFTVVGGEFQFYPVADKAYAAQLTYIRRCTALSIANPSNWILADYPDAYLYGALVQSAPYLKDDGRATLWGTLFTAALDDICNADPVPTDKSTLRTELAMLTRSERLAHYDINSDNF